MLKDLLLSSQITETVAMLRLGVALVCGACIGIEREYHKHQAGLRTFTLVCLGSALAMLVSIFICQNNTNLLNGDPGRIAAQVLTGIGFIGAGLIIKNEDGISGLTTAASIFMTAIIGLAIGVGMIMTGVVTTALVVIVLVASYVGKEIQKKRKNKE